MVGGVLRCVVLIALMLSSAAVLLLAGTGRLGQDCSIETAQQAVGQVYEYTGFEAIAEVSDSMAAEIARLEIVENDDTPFLYEYVNGRTVWKVKLDQIRLNLPRRSPEAIANQTPKNFEAWLDAETGQLLKIFSQIDGYDSTLAPEPPPESSTVELRCTGEVLVEYPEYSPSVCLVEALGNAAGSSPVLAKEILAVFVMWSYLDRPPRPVWSITGRGIPPMPLLGAPVKDDTPIYTRNRRRTIVDATTGVFLLITDSPHVLLRPEDRCAGEDKTKSGDDR